MDINGLYSNADLEWGPEVITYQVRYRSSFFKQIKGTAFGNPE